MRNRCCYWGYLPASSPGEYAALGKLAERERFEHKVRPLEVDLFGSKLSVSPLQRRPPKPSDGLAESDVNR
jgi:hypothetical protein